MKQNKKIKVALLLGGTSSEREVSKLSAASIYKALKNLDYEIVLIDPAYGKNQPKNVDDFFSPGEITNISNRNYVEAVNSNLFDNIDIAFLALHGKWGEDGTIQSLLELRGIKYTGSKVLSSSISMDKVMSKILFQHYGVATPKWIIADKNSITLELIKEISKSFGFPCVVKPNDEGSTVGLSICKNENDFEAAFNIALKYSNKVLIEEYIEGRELTVGILGDEVFPVLEIKPKHELYDYECKYTHGMSDYIVPADIPLEISNILKEQSIKAFKAVECFAYARIDFRLSKNLKPFCLEVNTLPGMTSTSLVPKMAKAVGISFEELVDRIIKLSL
jgi:D-alanine-D-alanine ligase